MMGGRVLHRWPSAPALSWASGPQYPVPLSPVEYLRRGWAVGDTARPWREVERGRKGQQ